MPCYHPRPAWRLLDGSITLNTAGRETIPSQIAGLNGVRCGSCIGCRWARARDWTLRARLELNEHDYSSWCTLTYDDGHVPVTLNKRHVQLWLKRVRKALRGRYASKYRPSFGYLLSGEYGARTWRPHYHALLFGIPAEERAIRLEWEHGRSEHERLGPGALAYVCGYVSKKISQTETKQERVDAETGEVYTYQPPFMFMSKRPGIGGAARRFTASWRRSAVLDGAKMGVPRYLAAAWQAAATVSDLQVWQREMTKEAARFRLSPDEREEAEQVQHARRARSEETRKL